MKKGTGCAGRGNVGQCGERVEKRNRLSKKGTSLVKKEQVKQKKGTG